MSGPILPGATIGVLGSGQLGRMFTMAARRLGYRVHTLSPDTDTPTGQVADIEVVAGYEDLDAVARFARAVDVVTFEFENVPAATAETAGKHAPVRPAGSVLHVTQNRAREKSKLASLGLPVVPHRIVHGAAELRAGLEALGTPAILKTASWGYDGKGQVRIDGVDGAEGAWEALKTDEGVLEAFVDFECEVSVVGARSLDGQVATYPLAANDHANHILDVSVAPAALPEAVHEKAREIAHEVLGALEVCGVLCIEFFVTRGDELIINELAPRPHNSGHLTLDGCRVSQFEQQLRAVCGLPLGTTELIQPIAMANLLGDLWSGGEPDFGRVIADPHATLHLYGKKQARPGRKMGHLTAVGGSAGEARERALAARGRLVRG